MRNLTQKESFSIAGGASDDDKVHTSDKVADVYYDSLDVIGDGIDNVGTGLDNLGKKITDVVHDHDKKRRS